MSGSDVTKDGMRGVRPGRDATVGANVGPGGAAPPPGRPREAGAGKGKGAEQVMVPPAQFRSYYGMPVINKPVWQSPDIPGYLFTGGLAGAGAVVAAAAQVTGRRSLARSLKVTDAAAIGVSLYFLVHDLGRRTRFFNMLRTFKVTSPMSVGSWLLAAYSPAAAAAALSEVTGILAPVGTVATFGAAALGPAVASYTAALIADTAVPAWHDGYREMPFVFVASAASAAAGVGMAAAPAAETGPLRRLGIVAGVLELALDKAMEMRMGMVGGAFREPKARRFTQMAEMATGAGVAVAALLGRRSRLARVVAGACLVAGSALTRFGIFEAGMASAEDPRYTIVPQRQRLAASNPRRVG
ncbi:MAG TPA: NrfD/PsrC family molybdoenzyme membrane anchor subunit [Acidimicrobiales bacterium]|nr:NrfD/PsrC family molybdoenzyme membrane anchor subunit [Acidimicrobiales bacterium]